MKPQIEPDHYFDESYDTKERFISYWHQINEIISLDPREVLEIGIGNGFISKYLKEKGIKIKTLDIDGGLNPDVIGSVLAIPFFDGTFDVVTCYELLEHLPYSNFRKALKEIHYVSQKSVILSLPDVTTVYRVNIELPRIKPIKELIPHPFPRSTDHTYSVEHCWEIGKKNYPLSRVESDIKQAGLRIVKTYRVFEWPYHRFFVLEKG